MRVPDKMVNEWNDLHRTGDIKAIAAIAGEGITYDMIRNAYYHRIGTDRVIAIIHAFYQGVKKDRIAEKRKMQKLVSQYA